MNAWLSLVVAILAEVIGTSALKASEGFSRLLPSVVVIGGYGIAFYFLSLTLKQIPVGIAYAVWSGAGTVLITLIGLLVFRQKIDLAGVVGIALIVGVILNYVIAPAANPVLLFAGVVLVVAAIIVDALAYRARGDEQKTDVARGLKLAIACGILMGVFYPLVTKSMLGAGWLGAYSLSFVFSLGVCLWSFLFNTWFMRLVRPRSFDDILQRYHRDIVPAGNTTPQLWARAAGAGMRQ